MSDKHDTIKFVFGVFAIAVVSAAFLLSMLYTIRLSNERYYATMNHCIEVGATWIPGPQGTSSCIMNNR